ncbi:MAG TPA: hypothetical protein VF208_01695 [Candidatus Binatia bacterium]
MEKIDPQADHLGLEGYSPGVQVIYKGKRYSIERRTTLASGEAAVVLQSDTEQFVVSASQFIAAVSS